MINELFCGNSTTSSKFECTKLGDINSIKLVDVQWDDNLDQSKVIYEVISANGAISLDWVLNFTPQNEHKYGLVGAVG